MSKELVWAEINLAALEHNFQQLASKVQNNAKICAIVKANAYGHGVIEVVKTVLKAGADYLAVARIDEAIQIRQAGFRVPILILLSFLTASAKTPAVSGAIPNRPIPVSIFK